MSVLRPPPPAPKRRTCPAALFDQLHDWVVTVDHKRLGIMYVLAGLVFSRHRGLRGDHDARAARVAGASRGAAADLQPALHHAWDDHGVPRGHSDRLRIRQLSRASHDRGARPRLPAPQRLRLLDSPLRRPPPPLQRDRRRRPVRGGLGARRGLVRLRPAHRPRLHPGQCHRLLESRHLRHGDRDHRHRGQPGDHHSDHAGPGDDPGPHARLRVDHAHHLGHDPRRPASPLRRPDHAHPRPLPRRPLLRHPGGRLRRDVAALLLVLRPSRGVHPHAARLRLRLRDHPRLLAQGPLRLSHDRGGLRVHRPRQSQRVGASHVRGRYGCPAQRVLRAVHHAHRRPHRDQDLQLAGHHVRRQARFPDAHALLLRLPPPVPVRGPHRRDALGRPVQLAAQRLVLRGRPLPLRARGQSPLHHLRRHLLLVPQGHRPHALRAARALAFLAVRRSASTSPSSPCTSRASSGCRGASTRTRPIGAGRSGTSSPPSACPCRPRRPHLRGQHHRLAAPRDARGRRSVERLDARVGDHLAAPALQLRDRPGDDEPPALWDLKNPDDPDGPHE